LTGKSIVLLSGSHLCHNPRVVKEAATLAREGYNVMVLGAWTDPQLKARDRALVSQAPFSFTAVIDAAGRTPMNWVSRSARRLLSRLARVAHRWTGAESRLLLGPTVTAMTREARELGSDLYVAHSEPALFVAKTLAQAGRRVAVDLEDWYSEDLLPEARGSRPVGLLRALEQDLLRAGAYSSCPSHAMSEALASELECPRPAVIYNAFPWSDRSSLDALSIDRADRSRRSIHWYSQTLGPGRGLEELFAALPGVRADAEVHLRGVPARGFEEWLALRTPEAWRNRVFKHPLVPNEALLSRIAEHDIGFAGETRAIRSRDLTVTNKILHYLLAGLAVVASDTAGQREVDSLAPGAVQLYPAGDVTRLASELNLLLDSPAILEARKAAALRAAESTFCWEKQEPRLLESVQRSLRGATR
jgi:hypothetical protein